MSPNNYMNYLSSYVLHERIYGAVKKKKQKQNHQNQ